MRSTWLGSLGVVSFFLAGCMAKVQPQGPTASPSPASLPPIAPSDAQLKVTDVKIEPNVILLKTSAGALSIAAVNDHVIRVRASRDGSFAKDFSWAVVPGANAPKGTFTVKDDATAIIAATHDVHVKVEKNPLRISFLDASDQVISEDAPGRSMSLSSAGFRVDKAMPEDEHYFGLGDKAGGLDRRDMAFTNWNKDAYGWSESSDPLYKTIPFFLGLRKGRAYGIFLDHTWPSCFHLQNTSRPPFP